MCCRILYFLILIFKYPNMYVLYLLILLLIFESFQVPVRERWIPSQKCLFLRTVEPLFYDHGA